MSWNDVIGHEWAVEMLKSGMENGRIGHAYLITGPDHIGKTTLARSFAMAMNCEADDVGKRPCGECRPCQLIAADRHPDIRLVEPEVSGRGKLTLKIDVIRQLQQDLNLSAYEATYKVAILQRFDAATQGAANAFLKTLEEPPKNVILVLTATDADTMLPTISSRCRTVNLRPLSTELVQQSLAIRWQVKEDDAHLLAHLADGRLGWAVQAAQDSAILEERRAQLNTLYDALVGKRVDRFAIADKLARKAEQLPHLLRTWLSWWRDITLLAQSNGGGETAVSTALSASVSITISNVDEEARLRKLAHTWENDVSLASLKQTNLALWQLERNANTRLVLENLLLTYPLLARQELRS
ncbi:MAG: DNA polymerase III subunit delta' [Chloroflexi bacterium]|nr:MAG: DNA polymerase III subunit delta' [Chloroflexota bacterium]